MYADIRNAIKRNDQAAIDRITGGREMRAVRVHRLGNGCGFHAGLMVSATLKGLTASLMQMMAEVIGTAAFGPDRGGEIDRLEVNGLDGDKTAVWYPASRTYQVWQNGGCIWESADGHVTDDPTALADCLS